MRKIFIFVLAAMLFAAAAHSQTSKSARQWFDDGLQLLQQKKYAESVEAFRASIKLDAKQPAALGNMGSALVMLNRPADAVLAYRDAVKLDPNDGTLHSALCTALTLANNAADAIKECEIGVRLNPNAAESYSALIAAMRVANVSPSDIQRQMDTAISRFPENELLLGLAAWYYKDVGNLIYAAELYEHLLRVNAAPALYHARLAVVYVLMERDADALSHARKALELEPNNPYALYAMGRLFFELGQNDEAANAFLKIPEASRDLPDAPYYAAMSEVRLGHQSNAVEILRQLVRRFPDVFEYQKELGRRLDERGYNEEAIGALKKAVELKPENIEALAGLSLAYSGLAQFDESIAVLEKAQKLYPGNQVIDMLLGVSRGRRDAIAQIPQMKTALENDPSNLQIKLGLSEVLIYAHRIPEAESYINDIIRLEPKDAQVYRRLTIAFSEAGEFDKALITCQKALEIEQSPETYLGLAGMYAKLGKFEEASRAYQKVIELKPDTPNVMKIYADLLRNNGKRREALEMYKRSLAILPLNPPALYSAGLLSAKLGDSDAALKYLETLKTVDQASAKRLMRCLQLKIWQ